MTNNLINRGNGYSVVEPFKTLKGSKLRHLSEAEVDREVHSGGGKEDKGGKVKPSIEIKYQDIYNIKAIKNAYERNKSKPGNMTPGTTGETLDGFSNKIAKEMAEELKNRSFKFKPSKRVYIPKKNGKLRPLGIPSPRDKIIQAVFTDQLEKVYEKKFLIASHGFRPRKSCHTALETIRK